MLGLGVAGLSGSQAWELSAVSALEDSDCECSVCLMLCCLCGHASFFMLLGTGDQPERQRNQKT